MSSYFNYEIDEHRIRIQLKEHQVFLSDNSWSNYQKYEQQFRNNNDKSLTKIKFVLNRNVILPVVFFGIIVFFTFILYKFLSIKNNLPLINSDVSISSTNKTKPISQKKALVPIKKVIEETIDSLLIVNKPSVDSISVNNATIKKTEVNDLSLDKKNESVVKKNNVKKISLNKTAKKNKVEMLNSISIPSLPSIQLKENSEPELK